MSTCLLSCARHVVATAELGYCRRQPQSDSCSESFPSATTRFLASSSTPATMTSAAWDVYALFWEAPSELSRAAGRTVAAGRTGLGCTAAAGHTVVAPGHIDPRNAVDLGHIARTVAAHRIAAAPGRNVIDVGLATTERPPC